MEKFNIKDFPVGKKTMTDFSLPSFYGAQDFTAPIMVYRATKKVSPCVVVTACVHGDEINGMHIAQSLIKKRINLKKGTLIIIPVLNMYGLLNKQRYLPDRRDLNRSFPGSENGSFGSRFAKFILDNFGNVGDFYIDLHSGGAGRFNIPQIRCDLKKTKLSKVIKSLDIPLVVNSSLMDGSFRAALVERGKTCLVFEGGEGLRISRKVTREGVNFVIGVLKDLKMVEENHKHTEIDHVLIKKTKWLRAVKGGALINTFKLGKVVRKNQKIGEIRDISGKLMCELLSPADGIILGMSQSLMVMEGDALYNLGFLGKNQPFEEDVFDWD